MKLVQELNNQSLTKVDGSDAGKNDVIQKLKADDVKFSLMRNVINSDGKITGSDVNNYLEKAKGLNDEVDSVLYGLETDDGEIVKVYVNASEADAFEAEMKKQLGMQDDIEEVINRLASKFDIVDVIWPKGSTVTDENGDAATDPEDDELDLGGDDTEGDDDEDDEFEVIASAADSAAGEDDAADTDVQAAGDEADSAIDDDEAATDDDESDDESDDSTAADGDDDSADDDSEEDKDDEEADDKAKKKDKHSKLKSLGKGMKSKTDEGVANMTIGKKFLDRVLAEGQLDEAKKDVDGFRDNIDIPGLDASSPLLAGQLPLAKLATQLYILLGVSIDALMMRPRAVKEGAAGFAEKMRANPTLKKTVIRLKDALGESQGLVRKVDEAAQDELRLQGGRSLAQMEAVLVAIGCPAQVIKRAMTRNRDQLNDIAVSLTRGLLRSRFAALATEVGVDLNSVQAGKVVEAAETVDEAVLDLSGAGAIYGETVLELIKALGVPDEALARNARLVLNKAFKEMNDSTRTNSLIQQVKRMTAQFLAAKERAAK